MAHLTDSKEIKQIEKSLGFTIKNSTKLSPEDFINQEFANLELRGFLAAINLVFKRMLQPEVTKSISLTTPPPKLNIHFSSSDNVDSDKELYFERTFYRDKGVLKVSHDYLIIPLDHRNKGNSKLVMALCLQQYDQMGVTRVVVHAGFENGGYAWARLGFRATNQTQVKRILDDAITVTSKANQDRMRKIYDAHYSDPVQRAKGFPMYSWAMLPFGKDVLMGTDWVGEFDLTDKDEIVNFRAYVES